MVVLAKFLFAFCGYRPFFAIRRFYYKFILCHINKETTYFCSFSSRVFCQHSEMLCNVAHDLCTPSRFIFNI